MLERLRAALTAYTHPIAISQPQAISGLGGIGKTQLAIEYAYRYRTNYSAVFWVRAESTDLLTSDFLTIAVLLGLPEHSEQEPTQDCQRGVALVRHASRLVTHPAQHQSPRDRTPLYLLRGTRTCATHNWCVFDWHYCRAHRIRDDDRGGGHALLTTAHQKRLEHKTPLEKNLGERLEPDSHRLSRPCMAYLWPSIRPEPTSRKPELACVTISNSTGRDASDSCAHVVRIPPDIQNR